MPNTAPPPAPSAGFVKLTANALATADVNPPFLCICFTISICRLELALASSFKNLDILLLISFLTALLALFNCALEAVTIVLFPKALNFMLAPLGISDTISLTICLVKG